MQTTRIVALVFVAISTLSALAQEKEISGARAHNYVAGKLIELNDNGAWSWFMDERAIVADNKLIVGSVRAVKQFSSGRSDENWGNVELSVHDIATGDTRHIIFDKRFEQDDHDGPALLALPNGRNLAVYTRHGAERKVFYRLSEPHDPLNWGPVHTFDTPGQPSGAFSGDNVTYSNLFRLSSGRIVNIFRGFDYDPNLMLSDDNGETWKYNGRLLKGRDGYGPYFKYAFDGDNTIHIVATEDHPRNFDNSLYHGYLRDGKLYYSNGELIGEVSKTTDVTLHSWDLTRIFVGDPDRVAWMSDIELDAEKMPRVVFTVQRDGRDLPRGQGGNDHRFHFARWDGKKWHVSEIAYAGKRLYANEDDYTGLAAIDPNHANVLYISTNADPKTGEPLISTADNQRHHELFRGTTTDEGATWKWTPITANSTVDNLRPIVPKWNDPRTALLWMRGAYKNNHGEWTTKVVSLIH